MVIKADHLPLPGETLIGGDFFMNAGGKGANQAVAAARAGGSVTFVAKVGSDIFGEEAVQLFKREGINTSYVLTDPHCPSGVALITVDKKGENTIVVASGANANLTSQELDSIRTIIEQSDIILMQLEIPIDAVAHVAKLAKSKNRMVVLNPAPACRLPDELFTYISIITPNETEAEILTGIKVIDIEGAKQAAEILARKGIGTTIITLGAKGALVYHESVFTHIPTIPVNAVDTTAAGDVFNGALVAALSDGKSILDAVAFACGAASISVTRLGAQASAPYKDEIELILAKKSKIQEPRPNDRRNSKV
jgi:ribokinase